MGIGIRLFFFDDNSVKRFSVAKFQRLWNGNVNEKIPQYAGKMIKYAMVIVETENRRPIKIIHWECSYIRIDSKGRFDHNWIEEMRKNAMDCMDPKLLELPDLPEFKEKNTAPNIINAAHVFARKKLHNKYRWIPTDTEFSKIIQLIFGKQTP